MESRKTIMPNIFSKFIDAYRFAHAAHILLYDRSAILAAAYHINTIAAA